MLDKIYKQTLYLEQNGHFWFRARKNIIINLFKIYIEKLEKINILDVGSLDGFVSEGLSEFGNIMLADKSPEKSGNKNTIYCDIESGEGLSKENDVVLALDVLEHIENDEIALLNIGNSLKKNGLLFLTVPAYDFLYSKHDELHGHKRRYTLQVLKSKVKKAGFYVEKISYFNTLLFIPILLFRIIFKQEDNLKMQAQIINKLLFNIFNFENVLLRYLNLPFGLSILLIARRLPE